MSNRRMILRCGGGGGDDKAHVYPTCTGSAGELRIRKGQNEKHSASLCFAGENRGSHRRSGGKFFDGGSTGKSSSAKRRRGGAPEVGKVRTCLRPAACGFD